MSIDTVIQELFTKLSARKAKIVELKATIGEKWKTNGTFRLVGSTSPVNLSTATVDVVEECAISVAMLAAARLEAGSQIGRTLDAKIQGYTAADWYTDFKKRLATINVRDEEKAVDVLESKLQAVLSPEERRRIEVEMLAKEI